MLELVPVFIEKELFYINRLISVTVRIMLFTLSTEYFLSITFFEKMTRSL